MAHVAGVVQVLGPAESLGQAAVHLSVPLACNFRLMSSASHSRVAVYSGRTLPASNDVSDVNRSVRVQLALQAINREFGDMLRRLAE